LLFSLHGRRVRHRDRALEGALAHPAQAIWNQNARRGSTVTCILTQTNADIWVFRVNRTVKAGGMLKAPVEPDPRILFFNADNRWVIAAGAAEPAFHQLGPTRSSRTSTTTNVSNFPPVGIRKVHRANDASAIS